MTLSKRPSEETLLAYATGALPKGQALVVETHLALCPGSRDRVAALEALGGALLDGLAPAGMSAGALSRVLARIDSQPLAAPPPFISDMPGHLLPLLPYDVGPWRWAGRGIRYRRILAPDDDGFVFMLKIGPGRNLPQHTHVGKELTCVLSGSYRVGDERFGPGDFDESGEETIHRPVVDGSQSCVCLTALQGTIRLQGPFGRWLPPFM